MTLAGQKPVAAPAALVMAPGPFVGSLLRRCLPRCFLGGALVCHGGQVGQLGRAVAVRAGGAVCLVELDGQLQGLVSLGAGRRGVLAAHFE